jgi:lipoprotein-anchoring transpeptidase ErfK/SrfK
MRLIGLVNLVAALALLTSVHPVAAQTVKREKTAVERATTPFMFGLFNAPKPELEPLTEEQTEYDKKWAVLAKKKKYRIKEEFALTVVRYNGYRPGTVVIDTKSKFLYFMESPTTAIRYGIAVGQEGLTFTGKTKVGDKKVWPRWTPTKAMIERSPGKYRRYSDGMDGGVNNPLGARAIYLYLGRDDTYLRIHGTNQPNTIGTASSNGCFRMHNEHVMDLYERVKMGADVVIL